MTKKLEIWLYGYGHMGKLHAKKLSQRNDVAVFVIDPKYKFPTTNSTLPDGVIVATPTDTHHAIALPFLQKKIPCLVEKAVTQSPESSKELADYPHLCVGHIERFGSVWRHLQHQKPQFIQADRITSFSNRGKDVDVILDLMIHDIDLCLQLMGTTVVDIQACGMAVLTSQIDIVNARIQFSTGVAQLNASRVAQNPNRTLRLFSTGIYWSANLKSQTLIRTTLKNGVLQPEDIALPTIDALENEHQHFIDFIKWKKPFPCTGTHGAKAVEIAQAIRESL